MRRIIFGASMFLWSMHAVAQHDPKNLMHVIGVGMNSCGDYLSSRLSQESPNEATPYNQWIDGFIVGMYAESGDPLPSDHAGIDAWMSNYCTAHPTDLIISAALQLAKEKKP